MQNEERVNHGFPPVFDKHSKVLILGSFPSVKSRQIDFYYGNKQNRFWKTLCGYFQAEIPATTEEKRDFVLSRNVALWDMVISCEIKGSSDASIKNVEIANLDEILSIAPIEKIILNGTLAYDLFLKNYQRLTIPYEKLPSTSPANPCFNEDIWRKALNDVFGIY
jgi:hypoxanthine-DNA glycosylase